jgi:GT2 family glycosyltransferase
MLSIVIPSYNRRDSTLRLLENVFQQDEEFEVIVVDDKSTDDTNEHIRLKYPDVILIENEINSGPAVSRNRGVKQARGEIVIGLDNDVTISDPFLFKKVRRYFEKQPSYTGLAFRLLTPDKKIDDAPRWWHSKPLATHAKKTFETSYFSGTGYSFRRKEFLEAGGYPEIFYMYNEEVLLAYRIIDNGGTIQYIPDLEVVHHAAKTARRNRIQMFFKPRNQLILATLCMSKMRWVCFVVPRLCFNFCLSLMQFYVPSFFSAIKDYAYLHKECLQQRRPLKRSTWKRIKKMAS